MLGNDMKLDNTDNTLQGDVHQVYVAFSAFLYDSVEEYLVLVFLNGSLFIDSKAKKQSVGMGGNELSRYWWIE